MFSAERVRCSHGETATTGGDLAVIPEHSRGSRVVTLEPGETKTVTFELAVNQLAFYDADKRFVVEPGPVEVMIGNSSRDIYCNQDFEISGDKTEIRGKKVFFSSAY